MEKVLLYYHYIHIESPHEIAAWQQSLCTRLGLLGRILIANEGVNGTVSGPQEATNEYKEEVLKHPLFKKVSFKEEDGAPNYFPRLQVTIKKSIVNFGISQNIANTGRHISPQEAHQLMHDNPDDFVVLDARNVFESRIGKFEGAITPSIEYFRDLPTYLDEHQDQFKNKRVLMYCTGGIRCELASAYLQEKNIAKEVMQLDGGIITYAQQFGSQGFFKGKNYVFDGRVAVPVTSDILTNCDLCNEACDEYTHCLNASCNKQFICCPSCLDLLHNMCSHTCLNLVEAGTCQKRAPFKKAAAHPIAKK